MFMTSDEQEVYNLLTKLARSNEHAAAAQTLFEECLAESGENDAYALLQQRGIQVVDPETLHVLMPGEYESHLRQYEVLCHACGNHVDRSDATLVGDDTWWCGCMDDDANNEEG
jgi:hypothetical protein